MPEPEDPRRTPQGVSYADLKHFVNADGQHLFCRYWEPEAPQGSYTVLCLPPAPPCHLKWNRLHYIRELALETERPTQHLDYSVTPNHGACSVTDSPSLWALVFVAHGAGEHSGPYDEIGQTLKEQSLLVFAHDHVGHGQSEGDRMNIKDFQVFVRDSLQHIDLMKGRHPDLPIFIIGHSMGGAISILTACARPSDFAGVALIAPMVRMNPESATPFKVFLAKVANHIVPSLTLGLIKSKWISRDQTQVEAYDTDELIYHGGVRVSFAMQMIGASERIERVIPAITWPFLLLHGDVDKLCDIGGSQMMFDKAPSTDKKIKVYDGAYHALHHELPETAASVLKEVTGWISERLPASPSQGP